MRVIFRGMAVQQFVFDYPEKVEKMVLVNSIAKMHFSPARKLIMSLSRAIPFGFFIKTNIQRVFKKGFPKEKLREFIGFSQNVPKHVVMSCYDAMGRWDVLGRLGSIKVKTLIIHVYHDAWGKEPPIR